MIFYILALVVSGLHGLLAYYVSDHMNGSLMMAVFQLAVSLFFIVPMILRAKERIRKRHECYRFINSFIISLSVVYSGEAAYETAILGARGEERKIFEGISEYGIKEKLDYLKTYFLEKYYGMFISIYELYIEQGGDILKMATPLLETATQVEEAENAKDKLTMANLLQTVLMWGLGDIILLLIRNSLANFYASIVTHPEFYLITLAYFFFQTIAFLLYAKAATEESIWPRLAKRRRSKKEQVKSHV